MADTLEKRVSDLEEMVQDIPGLINVRFAEAKADRAKLRAEISGLDARLTSLETKVDALPRVIAEMINQDRKDG